MYAQKITQAMTEKIAKQNLPFISGKCRYNNILLDWIKVRFKRFFYMKGHFLEYYGHFLQKKNS